MSNPYNPYASPLSQPKYHGMPVPPDKPAAITVFGILNLVFGALGVCNVGFAMLNFVVAMNNFPNQGPNPFADEPLGMAFQIAALAVSAISTAIIITGGILLLQSKELGRVLTIFYSWLSIGFGIVSILIVVVFMIRAMGAANLQGAEATGVMIGAIAVVSCGSLLGLIYPVLAIVFMTRENVKAYLKRAS
ncbi:MAG: hypothetical protein Q8M16_12055 [Pirellulaceae bacterium]|nr:hypothetical protein [Pirellulaceae bacterium]